jgi:acetate CoA/acetoacetate CoA-transferase alpha subunit
LVRKAIVSHIGLNPETQRQMTEGELEVELAPQGTLVERIRAGGYGLGGVLTQTGKLAVISFGNGQATLLETGPGVSIDQVLLATEARLTIPEQVPQMKL